ncbi:MAG: hypothetical protein ACKVWV_05075 [Planctomycetota bacterium]
MQRHGFWRGCAALTVLLLVCACSSLDVDESDAGELFVEGRIRKELNRAENGTSTHLELAWISVQGEEGPLEYAIDTLTFGAHVDLPFGTQGRFGIGGGLAWQANDIDIAPIDVEDENGLGPYIDVDCGWLPVHWLEPYARANVAALLNEVSTLAAFELGARVHAVEHATFYAAWRHAWYEMDDVDSDVGVSTIELDVSGLVVGVLLSF